MPFSEPFCTNRRVLSSRFRTVIPHVSCNQSRQSHPLSSPIRRGTGENSWISLLRGKRGREREKREGRGKRDIALYWEGKDCHAGFGCVIAAHSPRPRRREKGQEGKGTTGGKRDIGEREKGHSALLTSPGAVASLFADSGGRHRSTFLGATGRLRPALGPITRQPESPRPLPSSSAGQLHPHVGKGGQWGHSALLTSPGAVASLFADSGGWSSSTRTRAYNPATRVSQTTSEFILCQLHPQTAGASPPTS